MFEPFNSGIGQEIIGAFVGFTLSIIPILWLRKLDQSRKELSCFEISRAPMYFAESDIRGFKINIKIINSGKEEITADDFTKPLEVKFGEESSKIITAKITRTSSSDLGAEIKKKSDSFSLQPLLLNVGDFIEIEAIVEEPVGKHRPSARIKGVRRINSTKYGRPAIYKSALLIGIVSTLMGTIFFHYEWIGEWGGISIMVFGFILMFGASFSFRRFSER